MTKRSIRPSAGLAAVCCIGLASAALAGETAAKNARPMDAIEAISIAEMCAGTLSKTEVAELEGYIAKSVAVHAAGSDKDRAFAEKFYPRMMEYNAALYGKSESCTETTRTKARTALDEVRTSPGVALLSEGVDTRAPPGLAVAAKVIGDKCAGVLTRDETAEIAAYIAKARDIYAASKNENERVFGEKLFTSLEEGYGETYAKPENCNEHARTFARNMLDQVRASPSVRGTN